MDDDGTPPPKGRDGAVAVPGPTAASVREGRLKAALKANLARRKLQAHARDRAAGDDPEDRPG